MCALCGVFGVEDHWSAGHQAGANANPNLRRKARAVKVETVNKFLNTRGVQISDWQANYYVVANKTGSSKIVDNLSEIWDVIEKDFGGAFDPLSAVEIQKFSEKYNVGN